ncbi:homing endonuclease associated repeat-containing protein [Bacillus cereus]
MRKKNKRTPRQCDLSINDHACRRIFGSWGEAIRAAGLTPNYKKNRPRVITRVKEGF